MAELSIELVESNGASIELSSDGYAYASVEAEFSNIPETGVAIEAQIILYKGDTIVSASDPNETEVTSESTTIWLSDSFHSSTGQIPDSYCVCFRIFTPAESVSIMTPVPPEISRQSGSFLVHEPKKGFISREKWNSGPITVESVIVKNAAGDDDELFINLFSKKPLNSGFKLHAESSGNFDETIFQLADKPHMTSDYLRLHLKENLNVTVTGFIASDWNMSDKKPLLVSKNMAKKIEFTITGSGSEFQFHRLNQQEAETLKEMFENGNAHDLTGWNWSNSVCNGVYGVHVDDMVVLNEESGNEVDLDDINLSEAQKITDLTDGFEQSDCLDVFYFAPSSVTGRFHIELAESEEFEPSKLNINFLNYHLDGYPERYGKPISSIEYKGEEVSVEFEDTGGDSEFLCIGYEFEENEFLDHIIIFENLFSPGSDPSAAEWSKLAEIFGNKESASAPVQKKSTKSKKNSAKTKDNDWEEAGKRAFNRYFNMFDKTENHDDSQEMAAGEIETVMADAGIEIKSSWYEDLPADVLVGVVTGFINAYKYIPHEVGYAPSKDFMGVVHTWFSDCIHAANANHQDARLVSLIEKFNMSDLNELLFEVNDAWDHVYWELDEPIRENFISKYTKKYETVGLRVGLVGKTLQENGEADPSETDFVISINLICDDYDTSEPIDWKSLGIKEEMFEEVADAIEMQFSEWAENGAEDGELNFPAKIKSAFIDFDDETCSHYGTFVSWNDEKVY